MINRRITIMTVCGAERVAGQLISRLHSLILAHCWYVIHVLKSTSSHKLVELQAAANSSYIIVFKSICIRHGVTKSSIGSFTFNNIVRPLSSSIAICDP